MLDLSIAMLNNQMVILFTTLGDFAPKFEKPLVNEMETSLPTPLTARVYVNIPEATFVYFLSSSIMCVDVFCVLFVPSQT